jgi:hypothetical protein
MSRAGRSKSKFDAKCWRLAMFSTFASLGASLLFAFASMFIGQHSTFAQGSLNPPGAPAPTMKSLAQVEPRTPIASLPFIISQPGSYYLVTNLTDIAGTNGITVNTDNVTIDLSGFTLSGSGGTFFSGSGIYTGLTPRKNLTVRNGTVRRWGAYGIGGVFLSSGHFENVHVSENGNDGIVAGENCVIRGCTAQTNGSVGIVARQGSVIIGCAAISNNFYGIQLLDNGVVDNCTASFNQDIGIIGGKGGTVRGCSAWGNGSAGILVDVNSTVVDCTANTNGQTGFYQRGIHAEVHCTISRCTAIGNYNEGIFARDGSTVESCTVALNVTDGIKAGIGSTVRHCTTRANQDDGIEASTDCLIHENHGSNNGQGTATGAGVHITGVGNRVEGNSTVFNKRGFIIDAGANLVIRNSARLNTTNYVIVAGNNVGPIVLAPASGAISGSTGGAGVGSTDPWANISH